MTDDTIHPLNTTFDPNGRLDKLAAYLPDALVGRIRATGMVLAAAAVASTAPDYQWTPGKPYTGPDGWMPHGIQTMSAPQWEMGRYNSMLGDALRRLEKLEQAAAFVVPDEWMTGE